MSPDTFLFCVAAALAAGFVDAIAGGGGLVTVPALTLAGLDPVSTLATNKLQSAFGSGSALRAFARAGQVEAGEARPVAIGAGLGALAGAALVAHLPLRFLAAALPAALALAALYFALSPKLSDVATRPRMGQARFRALVVPLVGFYDGVFGPGAGSFYMLGFVALRGLGALKATALTKAANFASNLVALALLAATGHVWWSLGLAMGAAQFVGARLGARAAIRGGAALIRPMLVAICLAVAGKLALGQLGVL
ncbi:TSUP family transporter [Methylocella sp.]|uniref:TSUP family transporter n=1 Tax=Methylocella sp. TaxID=1978226 RepID=UPI0037830B81